jgi:uncharacterized membrane protein
MSTLHWKYFLVGILLLAAVLLATLMIYPYLPPLVPTHWNLHNRANGYSPKWMLFVIVPGMMTITMSLFLLLPWLSPKQFAVDAFQLTYLYIMVVMLGLLAYIHAVMLWAALSAAPDVGRAILGGLFLLFALLGNVLGKVRRNFYLGVRTPWTLANEQVWNATHRFAAKTFFVGGLLGLILTAVGVEAWFLVAVLTAGAISPVAYSLIFYKRLERRGAL